MTFLPSPLSYAEEASWAKLRQRGVLFFTIAYGSLYGVGFCGVRLVLEWLFKGGRAYPLIFNVPLDLFAALSAGWIGAAIFWQRQERRYQLTIAQFGKSTTTN
jgi:hypothetical protein